MTGCLVLFLLVWGVIIISNRKMTLATERGETSNNTLTIYPIQSFHCMKGLLMMNTWWPHNRIQDFWSKRLIDMNGVLKRSSYVYPQLWVSGTFKISLNRRNRGTLPPEIPLAIAKDIYWGSSIYLLFTVFKFSLPEKKGSENKKFLIFSPNYTDVKIKRFFICLYQNTTRTPTVQLK